MPDDEELLKALAEFGTRARRHSRAGWVWLLVAAALLWATVMLTGPWEWRSGTGEVVTPTPPTVAAATILVAISLLLAAVLFGGGSSVRRLRSMATRLAECDDLRAVGPLLEGLRSEDRGTRWMARHALAKLLPRLEPADRALLTPRQRTALCEALRTRHVRLALAALKALAQVGDEASLWYVERLTGRTEGSPAYLLAYDEEVRQAARACEQALRFRLEQERLGQALLRPAASPTVGGEALLRPAHGAAPAAPERLLRPVETEQPDTQQAGTGSGG